jgi:hypothetical protein
MPATSGLQWVTLRLVSKSPKAADPLQVVASGKPTWQTGLPANPQRSGPVRPNLPLRNLRPRKSRLQNPQPRNLLQENPKADQVEMRLRKAAVAARARLRRGAAQAQVVEAFREVAAVAAAVRAAVAVAGSLTA